ncbi:MAG TPA: hypothetical protein VJW77_01325 [Terriglobia bacterium]|nr:hypothetical protein [Terriglobia bacterium]
MVDKFGWSESEKQIARRAFDAAYASECQSIRARVQEMLKDKRDTSTIWRIQDYLSKQRKQIDRKYDYRYSRLINVFAILLNEGWLPESNLSGLGKDKIARIKELASYR